MKDKERWMVPWKALGYMALVILIGIVLILIAHIYPVLYPTKTVGTRVSYPSIEIARNIPSKVIDFDECRMSVRFEVPIGVLLDRDIE